MASQNFARALEFVLAHEGGYVDHPRDPGGATNRGITRVTLEQWRGRPVTKAEVRALTRAEAVAIYRAMYWNAVAGDDLPAGLDLAVFDFAVNSGPGRATKTLQSLLEVTADGVIGPVTRAAAHRRETAATIRDLCTARMAFLKSLKTFATFGKGWTARVQAVERAALQQAQSSTTIMGDTAPAGSRAAGMAPSSPNLWDRLVAFTSQVFGLAKHP